ncbi:hypothetical protein V491_04994 [Pseudogymnoascus sp. VKM F-3775]|nr:hypothetical protein V491_04994 [Pseudogymnoascus sp. VKM F-3775]
MWPRDRAAVPKTIYECDPPFSQSFDARMYTCFNDEIELGSSDNTVVVPGADVKEAFKAGEGSITASKVKVNGDKGAPERIRDYQLKKAKEAPKCDGRTGVAVDTLHWGGSGIQNHDAASTLIQKLIDNVQSQTVITKSLLQLCGTDRDSTAVFGVVLDSVSWAVRGGEVRREVLRERAERGYEINSRIRKMWEDKNEELKVIEGWKGRGGKEKAILEREERFWKESFEVREEGREVDGGVEREFEKRMKGEVWGEVVEKYRSWEKENKDDEEEDDDCEQDDEDMKYERPRKCESVKGPKRPKEPEKPQSPKHPGPRLGKSHYDRPKAMKAKPARVKVKGKNGRVRVKVKDGHADIRVKGKNGRMNVNVKENRGEVNVKSG